MQTKMSACDTEIMSHVDGILSQMIDFEALFYISFPFTMQFSLVLATCDVTLSLL